MFLLIPTHPACPGQGPEICKMVVVVMVLTLLQLVHCAECVFAVIVSSQSNDVRVTRQNECGRLSLSSQSLNTKHKDCVAPQVVL